jgi:DNA-directed RNA polymerase specialized sigma24 family protein
VDQAACEDPEVLLIRMRDGDRDAAASFLRSFGPRIRRRIRGKLGASMRRLFDSQEIMSTLGRRLDSFVGSHQLRAENMPELWALVFRLADNSLIEKARVFRSLEAKEGEDSPVAHAMANRLRAAERAGPDGSLIEIDRAIDALTDAIDREILSLWLMGSNHAEIGQCVNLAPTAVRKRWQSIREKLRELYESGGC